MWRKRLILQNSSVITEAIEELRRLEEEEQEGTNQMRVSRDSEPASLSRKLFLGLQDVHRFRRCLRMNEDLFTQLLGMVTPLIHRQDTGMRNALSPEERLSLTLRYLATGETQESLKLDFRIGQSTINRILRQMSGENQFAKQWNFPNCLGAVEGKCLRIETPPQRELRPEVLLAVVDADSRFIFVDFGPNDQVWVNFALNRLRIPRPSPVNPNDPELPYVFIADKGFKLQNTVLIPYPRRDRSGEGRSEERRAYNDRLSRARMCSENGFGVLAARFQVFQSKLRCDLEEAAEIVMACCCIHNWLRTSEVGRALYTPSGFLDIKEGGTLKQGEWRNEPPPFGLVDLLSRGGNRHTSTAISIREQFAIYFYFTDVVANNTIENS